MTDFKATPIPEYEEAWHWSAPQAMPIQENNEELVPLSYIDRVITSPQYAIQGLSGALTEIYARQSVQAKLAEATKLLPEGLRFVVFDAWRSFSTQMALFNSLSRKYAIEHPDWSNEEIQEMTLKTVAMPSRDPLKPSPHNTGGSIDLTIVDANGCMLNMASPFDDIEPTAQSNYFESREYLDAGELAARDNRRLLYNIMTTVGFTNYDGEWWHYDYGNQNWAWRSGNNLAHYGATKPIFPWTQILD
ncbi:MAG: M15 family metallopeptidase [Lactobacillaceae bacterium]|jgi:D-alanyl-D-alanine dipeptidase|nr:M15 family metallopeptidase [Lactobacillaceae bacterium]